jgi:primosomal protein N' (replication factor Y)
MDASLFADIILPLPIDRKLTYAVPAELAEETAVGKRVIVPVGKNKLYSGLVSRLHYDRPGLGSVKDVRAVLDDKPIVHREQLDFWDWIVSYYLCQPGDVFNAAVPSALRLQSETTVVAGTADKELPSDDLEEDERFILDLVTEKSSVSVQDIQRLFPGKAVQKKMKRLMERGLVMVSEEIGERYKPLKESRLRIATVYSSDREMEQLFAQMEKDKRKAGQLEALMQFLKLLYDDKSREYVRKKDLSLLPELSASSVQSLVRNGILEEFEAVVDRIRPGETRIVPVSGLTAAQQSAHDSILEHWKGTDTVLLHGVTSSGKTEIYLHLIEAAIARGEQVLYLLPEIALTAQMIQRLQRHLGDRVGVYHSKYTSNERVEIWNRVLNFDPDSQQLQRAQVVLGARSALFLPFSRLGLVIVDEEHDTSYKQFDPAPRYNARDAAIVLAKQSGAKVLLGSATPAVESYHNACRGRYGLVTLTERFGGVMMPGIIVTDIKEAARKRLMKSHFSPLLMETVQQALKDKEQVILFQNRRGFSTFLECRQCGWIPHCMNCSVTLTYHKSARQLRCHYCDFKQEVPGACMQCGDPQLAVRGFGTEKIEEEIGVFFPEHRVARLDLDTAHTKSSYQRILSEFEEGRIDILVGTQMISKGLDFDNVSTVGVLDADQMINFPDFRAHERAFQLMAQVSGRSGRKNRQGKVVIQTRQPDHWVIRDVVRNDYVSFFRRELDDRKKFGYPPHARLVELSVRHPDEGTAHEGAVAFCTMLRNRMGAHVHGPHVPLVSRVRNRYIRGILVQLPPGESPGPHKEFIRTAIARFRQDPKWGNVQVVPDVDPL